MDGKCCVTECTPGDWGMVIVFGRGNKKFSVTPHHAYSSSSVARRAARRVAESLGIDLIEISTYPFE